MTTRWKKIIASLRTVIVLWFTLGVNFASIMVERTIRLEGLRGKESRYGLQQHAVPVFVLIHAPDGTPLKDWSGNITSHLAGLMFRSTSLVHDYEMDLVFVFDGEPPQLKKQEIVKRRELREKAILEWEKALKAGDYATAFSKAVMTSRLTRPMVDDAQRLLELIHLNNLLVHHKLTREQLIT